MAFSENVKYKVKKSSHQSCCICKSIGIEIHHIVPQSEGGDDILDNAAPLCPSCHEIYGQNPTKRKFIKESRNIWYEICEKRYSLDDRILKKIVEKLENIETYLLKNGDIPEGDPLTFGQIMEFFLKFKYPTDINELNNFETTFKFLFGTIGDEENDFDMDFNEYRNYFYQTFGRMFSEKLVIYLIDQLKINWNTGVDEFALSNLLNSALICMIGISENNSLGTGGQIKLRLNSLNYSNELVFSLE